MKQRSIEEQFMKAPIQRVALEFAADAYRAETDLVVTNPLTPNNKRLQNLVDLLDIKRQGHLNEIRFFNAHATRIVQQINRGLTPSSDTARVHTQFEKLVELTEMLNPAYLKEVCSTRAQIAELTTLQRLLGENHPSVAYLASEPMEGRVALFTDKHNALRPTSPIQGVIIRAKTIESTIAKAMRELNEQLLYMNVTHLRPGQIDPALIDLAVERAEAKWKEVLAGSILIGGRADKRQATIGKVVNAIKADEQFTAKYTISSEKPQYNSASQPDRYKIKFTLNEMPRRAFNEPAGIEEVLIGMPEYLLAELAGIAAATQRGPKSHEQYKRESDRLFVPTVPEELRGKPWMKAYEDAERAGTKMSYQKEQAKLNTYMREKLVLPTPTRLRR